VGLVGVRETNGAQVRSEAEWPEKALRLHLGVTARRQQQVEAATMANRISASETRKMKAALGELKDSTRDDYQKLAEHFFKTRLDGQPRSPKRICDALRLAAAEYRPDYWRRLRNALMYDQVAAGYPDNAVAIAEITNPVTQPKTAKDRELREQVGGKPGTRQQRVKRISKAEYNALKEELIRTENHDVAAAVMIAELTGARPAEMLNIECRNDGTVFITGSKKGADGRRGLDRHLALSSEDWGFVSWAVTQLKLVDPGKAGTMRKIQDRLRTATQRIWPRRKSHPTLYTWRYEMGSELKASRLSRHEIAYVMGHQATASVDRYGDRRSGSGKTPIKAAPDADMSGVRETHSEPFSQSLGFDEGPLLG